MRPRRLIACIALSACECGDASLRPADTVLAAPPALEFGDVPVGTTSTIELRLSVTGPGSVQIISLRVEGNDDFAAPAVPGDPVAAGSPALLAVTFRPEALGAAEATLHVDNDSLRTPDLAVPLRGRGVEPPQTGPGGGSVGNCSGLTGSPSCDIIQVPAAADAQAATAVCPDPYKLIGCGFLCDAGARPGGTEMVDESTCRAHCQDASRAEATAFCYRGDPSYLTRVVLTDAVRDTVGECPSSHPQVLGCTTRCVNGAQSNNPGGATLSESGRGCRVRCDYPGDYTPQLVVYCGGYPKAYSQVVKGAVPSGSEVTCGAGTTLAGGLGMCVNGRTGGFIAQDSRRYVGLCNDGLALDQIAAFCLQD
jgi:hypothetical protein